MSWPVQLQRTWIDLRNDRVQRDDALRQMATAKEILRRFEDQPGVVLADEVGMGKTFVALAVAASVAWNDKRRRPVVVMVPPSLRYKWPTDFGVFVEHCVRGSGENAPDLRAGVAERPVEFLKLLDDPVDRRCHIIFLTHGALYRSLADPWTKLAIIKEALRSPKLKKQRKKFHTVAARLLRIESRYPDPELFKDLLRSPTKLWRDVLTTHDEDPGDEPVPEQVEEVLAMHIVDLAELRLALEGLPIRRNATFDERLRDLNVVLRDIIKSVWTETLRSSSFSSPLLILDEAHHVKNPATRLASLFVDEDARGDVELLGFTGALADRFERMLFLTATPFQLGHSELLNVLDRFHGIRWTGRCRPLMKKAEFGEQLSELRDQLDEAHRSTAHFDKVWGKISDEDVAVLVDDTESLDNWWSCACEEPTDQPKTVYDAVCSYIAAHQAMASAERLLAPWVLRHLRPQQLPCGEVRRRRIVGEALMPGVDDVNKGIRVDDNSLLPFLLAARLQSLLVQRRAEAKTATTGMTFAEGLGSSYEAFLETQKALDEGRSLREVVDEIRAEGSRSELDRSASWYLERLATSLPRRSTFRKHPKVFATVERTIDLWRQGEKVLIFCHWRATGRAMQIHISRALREVLVKRASESLGCSRRDVKRELENVSARFASDRPVGRHLRVVVRSFIEPYQRFSDAEQDEIVEVIRRFVRSQSFLVRYYPLGKPDSKGALVSAFQKKDRSRSSLRDKIHRFVKFLSERTSDERTEFLQALRALRTGARSAGTNAGYGRGSTGLLPNVRLANGETPQQLRRNLLLAFNSPFFPEVLIASSVMAEGVDLQLDCRFVIHHDLCWNPSTMEQRTGRVDRIGAKAEKVGRPIHVYWPYVAETQDEKMYRVVRDRERWFQVIMGDEYSLEDDDTEAYSRRIPLPETAASELAFQLAVHRKK